MRYNIEGRTYDTFGLDYDGPEYVVELTERAAWCRVERFLLTYGDRPTAMQLFMWSDDGETAIMQHVLEQYAHSSISRN